MDLIGYPEHVLNSTWLNRQYEEVDVSPDYLMNIIAFQSYKRKEGMRIYIRLVLDKMKRLKFFDKKNENISMTKFEYQLRKYLHIFLF